MLFDVKKLSQIDTKYVGSLTTRELSYNIQGQDGKPVRVKAVTLLQDGISNGARNEASKEGKRFFQIKEK